MHKQFAMNAVGRLVRPTFLAAALFAASVAMGEEDIVVPTAAQRAEAAQAAQTKKEADLRAAVAHGDPQAMYALYTFLRDRRSLAYSSPEMKKLLADAANGGDWQAMQELSDHYKSGTSMEKDPSRADAWAQKAAAAIQKKADAGDPQAMTALGGRLKSDGKYGDAAAWYEKAANAGNARAMYELASTYFLFGDKFGKEPSDGWIWMEKSANAGSIDAMMRMARRAERAKPPRGDEAAAWYARAADNGSAFAMRELGQVYRDGKLVHADAAKAISWYQRAAARDGSGLASIGDMYAGGTGVSKDQAVAVQWYRKAADAGDAEGMYDLASCMMAGSGVARDAAEAMRWLTRAADAGSSDAERALMNLGIERAPRGMGLQLPEIKLDHVGFSDAIQFLSDLSGVSIYVDWAALDAAGIKRDAPLALHFDIVTMHDALAQCVDAVGKGKIAMAIIGGQVVISTPAGGKSLAALRARHRVQALDPQSAQLQRVLPDVKFDGVGLSDVIDFMRDVSGVKLEMPAGVLKAAKIAPDAPITLRARNISFNIALEQILHSAGGDPPLDYEVRDGKVVIVTTALAEGK